MIRELADHDLARIPEVLRYPIRDALVAFAERMKREAIQAYRHDTLVFVLGGSNKQPSLPSILQQGAR